MYPHFQQRRHINTQNVPSRANRPKRPPPALLSPISQASHVAMSSAAPDGGLSCSVCLEGYTEEDRRPLMLPACGHTFCKLCMSTVMVREGARGTFLCPACRRPQPVRAVEDLPVNYSLLEVAQRDALLSGFSSAAASNDHSKKEILKPGEGCPEHGSRRAFWCVTCEVAACGECLFDMHPRPAHDVMRLQDQLHILQEGVRVRAVRLVSQLVFAAEENRAGVRAALTVLVEHLRQRRVLHNLWKGARTVRETATAARDFGEVTSVGDTINAIQKEFQEAEITTSTRVCVSSPSTPSHSSPSSSPSIPIETLNMEDQHPIPLGDLHLHKEVTPVSTPPNNKPPVPDKPSTLSLASLPAFATPLVPPSIPPSTMASYSPPRDTPTPSPPPGVPPPWPPLLCGVLNGNWTAGRMNLEPRGLHVYSLKPMKEKCDLFVNMGVVSALAPLEAPEVFLDLCEADNPLGRIYITLQSHLGRAQQFLTLCVGEKGPSYKGSFFHSVIRKGGVGEGLVGGDYEGKAGKGGALIFGSINGEEEVAKRCERGMVVRGSSRVETAAQFCIMVRDGPRNKAVFPFGRVRKGLSVVEEACKRSALSVKVAECGWVLPVS